MNFINFDFKKNMKSKIVIIFRISFKKQFYVLFLKTVVWYFVKQKSKLWNIFNIFKIIFISNILILIILYIYKIKFWNNYKK